MRGRAFFVSILLVLAVFNLQAGTAWARCDNPATDYCNYTDPTGQPVCAVGDNCTSSTTGNANVGLARQYGIGGTCGDPDEVVGRAFDCVPGSTCGAGGHCYPTPPTCTISGPANAYRGSSVTYPTTYSVTSANGIAVTNAAAYWDQGTGSWTSFCSSSSSPFTCNGTVTFTTAGTSWVVCNVYSSPAGYTPPGFQATGNPACQNGNCLSASPPWYDASPGNNNSRIQVTASVDTTGPSVSVVPTAVTPVGARIPSPSNASSVTFTASATDSESGLTSVQISVNSDPNGGVSGSWTILGSCVPNPIGIQTAYNCIQTWSGTTAGRHAIRVIASDRAGNTTTNNTAGFYLIDKTAPVYTAPISFNPASGSYTSQVGMTAFMTDAAPGITTAGVSQVDIYVNTQNGAPASCTPTNWRLVTSCSGVNLSSCNGTWVTSNTGSLPGESHQIAVNALDAAGNLTAGYCPSSTTNGNFLYQLGAASAFVCN